MTDATTAKDLVIPEQEDLMNAIVGQLYDKLTGSDGDVLKQNRDAFFAWITPGLPISEDQFDFVSGLVGKDEAESSRRFALAADCARLLDIKPDPSGVISGKDQQRVLQTRTGTLSGEWDRVLRMSQVADTPLTDEQQANLDRLEGLLVTTRTEKDLLSGQDKQVTDDSDLVKIYNEKMAAYEAAALEFNATRIDALTGTTPGASARFAINGPILSRRVRAALDDWEAAGHRSEVEQIRAHIAQVTGRSMVAYKRRLIERFERSKLTDAGSGVEFNYCTLSPANILRSDGWTTFEFNSKDSVKKSSSKTNKWSAGGGFGFGGFSFGGKASGERTKITSSLDMRNFSLKFEMAQAIIGYPFLDLAWLESTGWRFTPGEGLLTDGKEPPTGSWTAIPRGLVLVRGLELTFDELHDSSSEIHSKLDAGGSVGYGLFNLSGSYGRETNDKTVESHADGQGIKVPGPQIIGFRCYVLPGPRPAANPEVPEDRWV